MLVVDDNADMRAYLTRLLGPHWTVRTTGQRRGGPRGGRRAAPDLVLTDVMMPRIDGFELLRALRADPATRDIPVIMLTARAGQEASVEGLEAGADDYLAKPFRADELIARVRAVARTGRRTAHGAAPGRRPRVPADRAPLPVAADRASPVPSRAAARPAEPRAGRRTARPPASTSWRLPSEAAVDPGAAPPAARAGSTAPGVDAGPGLRPAAGRLRGGDQRHRARPGPHRALRRRHRRRGRRAGPDRRARLRAVAGARGRRWTAAAAPR